MAQVVLRVQGADPAHTTRDVLLDQIDDADHAIPVYKLAVGEEGKNAGLISSVNPMPVASGISDTSARLLQRLLTQQRLTNLYLSRILNDNLTEIDLE